MTEIEKKALALVRECESDYEALCRAIEQHEAFRQEVSDAVAYCVGQGMSGHHRATLDRFIISKHDLLVEALMSLQPVKGESFRENADRLREALAKRGLQVTEIER